MFGDHGVRIAALERKLNDFMIAISPVPDPTKNGRILATVHTRKRPDVYSVADSEGYYRVGQYLKIEDVLNAITQHLGLRLVEVPATNAALRAEKDPNLVTCTYTPEVKPEKKKK